MAQPARRPEVVDEALQLQTYQAALKGSKMAVREVLKMIEKRESALATLDPPVMPAARVELEHDSDNSDEAMLLLGIAAYDTPEIEFRRLRMATWAAQAGISRAGRRKLDEKERSDVEFFTLDSSKLRWPRGRGK